MGTGIIVQGFSKIRSTFLGIPIIRTIVYLGLFWGTHYFGKLPYRILGSMLWFPILMEALRRPLFAYS